MPVSPPMRRVAATTTTTTSSVTHQSSSSFFPRFSSPALYLYACFVLLSVLSTTFAQTCAPVSDPTCSEWIPVGTPVYVPPDIPAVSFLELYANRLVSLTNYAGVPDPCRSWSNQLICLTWLRPCQTGLVNASIPKQPCTGLCENFIQYCAAGQQRQGEPVGIGFYYPAPYSYPLNCSNPPLDVWNGNASFYRANFSDYTYNNVNYTDLPCSNPVPDNYQPIYCQDPLELTTRPAKNSPTGTAPACAFSCPLPALTDDQYDNAKIMQGIVGWFSWAGTAVLILVMLVNPGTRDFPRNLILLCACAANVAAGAIILPTYATYKETWCGGDVFVGPSATFKFGRQGYPDFTFYFNEEDLVFHSSLCTFQGAMLQFGFLASVFWWVIIAFNMCLELYFGKLLPLEKSFWKWGRFVVYNALVWGLAFVLMVIPASADRIGFSSGGTYCFVTEEDDDAWLAVFWYVPVGISLVSGVSFFLLALVRITILLVTIKKMKKLFLLYIRLLVFIFLYLFLFVFIFAYNIQISKDNSEIVSGYEEYFKCLIYSAGSCSLSESISNYDLVMLKGFAISALGSLLFFIFFFSWDIWQFYYSLVKVIVTALYQRKPQQLGNAVKMVAYPSSSKALTMSGSLSVVPDSDISDSELAKEQEEEEGSTDDDGDDATDKSSSSSND